MITGVGDHTVAGMADAGHAIREQLKANQAVALRILRNGQPVFVAVELPGGKSGDDSQDDGNG